MVLRRIILSILLVFPLSGFSREKEPYCYWDNSVEPDVLTSIDNNLVTDQSGIVDEWATTHLPYGFPASHGIRENEELLPQKEFLTWYDTDLRNPIWVAYRLSAEDIGGPAERQDSFRSDPRLQAWERADCADYREPIFDQGHMVPYADLSRSADSVAVSFLMSNIVPQYCEFNRGPWLVLEALTRDWARYFEVVWVVSGTVFDRYGEVGRDADQIAWRMAGKRGTRVAIPSHFYKIITRKTSNGWESLAFMLPNSRTVLDNDETEAYLNRHITTISGIYSVTGIRFFDGQVHKDSGLMWPTPDGFRSQLTSGCKGTYPQY